MNATATIRPRVHIDREAGAILIDARADRRIGRGGILAIRLDTVSTDTDIRDLLDRLAGLGWCSGQLLADVGNLAFRELRRQRQDRQQTEIHTAGTAGRSEPSCSK